MNIPFDTVLLHKKKARVLQRACKPCLRCWILRDVAVEVCAVDEGGDGQLPRNDHTRSWLNDPCHVERNHITLFGAVDNSLQIVANFFKDSVADDPCSAI